MKIFVLIVVLNFVSCSFFHETVGYQKYSIPHGQPILLVPTVSTFYSDDHPMEKEIILQIIEDLERNGFLVIERNELHEFKEPGKEMDRFSSFQNKISPNISENKPRIHYWIEEANRLEIPYIILIRFPNQPMNKPKLVRMFWLHLKEKETEQFDWEWKQNSNLPHSKLIQGKQ